MGNLHTREQVASVKEGRARGGCGEGLCGGGAVDCLSLPHPLNSYVEILTPKVGILAGALWEVIRLWGQSPHAWDWCPYKGAPRAPAPLPPGEDTAVCAVGVGPQQTLSLPAP